MNQAVTPREHSPQWFSGCGHSSESCWHWEGAYTGEQTRDHRKSTTGSAVIAAVLRKASRGKHCCRGSGAGRGSARRPTGTSRIGWHRSRPAGELPREPNWLGRGLEAGGRGGWGQAGRGMIQVRTGSGGQVEHGGGQRGCCTGA